MKVTFVLHAADMSGGTRVVAIHAQMLRQHGHEVQVVSLPARSRTVRQIARTLMFDRRWTPPISLGPSHLDGMDIPHKVLESHRPIIDSDVPDADAVIATWWQTAPWVAALSLTKGAKLHLVQHYEDWSGDDPSELDRAYQLPLRKLCVSQWLVDLLHEKFGVESDLVPNGVDCDQFHAPPRSRQPVPTVGMMYSTVPFKGCNYTLKAFASAAARVPGLRMLAFGRETPSPRLPLPPGTQFIHMPRQDQIRDCYAACDAWLVGSVSEGFGLPILEAMACRTPVISTPAGVAPQLEPEGGLRLVNGNDPETMARQIESIAGLTDSQWRALSDAACATASKYTWEQAADKFQAALQIAVSAAVRQAGHGK